MASLLFIGLAWTAAAHSLAQPKLQPAASSNSTAAEPLRRIEAVPDGGLKVTQPGAVVESMEYRGYNGLGIDGRCLTVFSPGAAILSTTFKHGNDDALGFVGDTRGSLVVNCHFPVADWRPAKAYALIAGTHPTDNTKPGPIYGAAEGYACQFVRNDFGGGAIRIRDGVWQFIGGDITISHLYGIDMKDPTRANVIGVNFRKIPAPPESGYWGTGVPIRLYRDEPPRYPRTNLKSRLYIANCTINGVAATPQEICPGVPTNVFVKEPLSK